MQKCALFADDILLFINSPLISLPNICKFLDSFGTVSVFESKFLEINGPKHRSARSFSREITTTIPDWEKGVAAPGGNPDEYPLLQTTQVPLVSVRNASAVGFYFMLL